MRVKMKSTMAGPEGTYVSGSVIDLPDAFAHSLVVLGYAEEVNRPGYETAEQQPAAEKAVTPESKKK